MRTASRSLRPWAVLATLGLVLGLVAPAAADSIPDPGPGDVTAQFSVDKTASSSEVGPGDTFVYTISVGCSAISDLGCRNAITTDTVPAPLQIQSATAAGQDHDSPQVNGQDVKVTWTQVLNPGAGGDQIGMLDNSTGTVTITVKVPEDIPYDYNDQTLTNTATAEATNADDTSDSASVHVTVPLHLDTTATKTLDPASAPAEAGAPVTASLSGSNDSNATVDSLVIQDPPDPNADPNPFTYLGFTGFGDVTAPAGTTGTTYEVYVDGAWVDCPGGDLPQGVDPADVEGTRVTFTGAIPPGETGSVDLDLATTDDAASVPDDTTVTNRAESEVDLNGQDATDDASADFRIRANKVSVEATKSFDPDLVIAGNSTTVTIGGTNTSAVPIDSLKVSEPATGSFPDDYTFGGFTAGIAYPAGATSGTVTYQPSGEQVSFADGATPAPPAGGAGSVTSFEIDFTGDIQPGAEVRAPFDVDTDPDATGLPRTVTNKVGVEGENNGASADATADDDLYIYNEVIEPYIDKQIRPSQILAVPGQIATVTLQGGTTERPNPPDNPDGTTGNADQIVIQDPKEPIEGDEFWNAFDLETITQTPIPADATLTVEYYDTTDDTWKTLDGPISGPTVYSYDVPQDISEVAGGVRFTYDYTGSNDGFPPGTDLAPNFTVSLRDQGRYDAAAPPFNTDPDNPDTILLNCAESDATSPTPGVPRGRAALADADCPRIDLVPTEGNGGGDLIDKTFGTSSDGGKKSVIARSGDTIPSTLSWSTGGYSDLKTEDVTDVADPQSTAVADSMYDAFDLTRVQPITDATDPHLKYDQITQVQLWNGTQWVDATNDPCPSACDGTFPGMNLTGGEQDSTEGVRLIFAESPTRAQTAAGDLDAPPVGSGVARSSGNDRQITLVWRIRDTKRSDGSPVLEQDHYNRPDPGVVRNTANATGYPADGSAPISDDDHDDVLITDVPITSTTTKTWSGGPLAIPSPGTPADQYPLSDVAVTTTNTTPARVDQLQITDPAPGSTTTQDPFDYFDLNDFAQITTPDGATSTTVTITCVDNTQSTYNRADALALTPATMPCAGGTEVATVQVHFDGRIASGAAGVLKMDVRLRADRRDTGDPITVGDSPIADTARGVVADVDAIGDCPPAQGARYACDEGTDRIELAAPTFGVTAGKSISPASQNEGDDAPVTVTISEQNSGSARAHVDELTDDDPTFFNAMDFVQLDPSWTLPQPVKYVRACYLSGGSFTDASVAGDSVGGDWTCEPLPADYPNLSDGELTLDQARSFIAAAPAGQIHGLRFYFEAGSEVGWQNPADPLIQVPFQVQRRDTLRTGEPVPTNRSDQQPAPGEDDAGVFVDTVEAQGESVLIGPDTRLNDDDTADADYTYNHDTVSASVDKQPEGEVAPGNTIPFTLTYKNTGEAPITNPVFTDELPTDADGAQLIFDPDSDPNINSPYSFKLQGAAPTPPNGDPLPTDQSNITITQANEVITFAMPDGTVLEPGQTYTITIEMELRPGLTPGDLVTNTATLKGDEPFDSCAPRENAAGACYDTDTVSPVKEAAVSAVKLVKADDPVHEPGIPTTYLDRDVIPAGESVPDDYCDTAADADGFYRAPCVPMTLPGDTETWRMKVTNTGTLPVSQLVEMDNLPTPGDTGVIVKLPRDSQWSPTYADSLELITPDNPGATMTEFYSTDSSPCTDDLDPLGPQCPAGDWKPLAGGTPDGHVAAIKFVVDFTNTDPFEPGDQLYIQGKTTTTPTDVSNSAYPVAWNTAATGGVAEDGNQSVTVPATEGRKVGVTYPTGPIELQKTVTGDGARYAPDSFTVQPTCTVNGQDVNGLQPLTLVPGDPPTVIEGLPYGAVCTATETDQGQTSKTIGTATVGGPDDDIGLVSIDNVYRTGAMTLTKTVDSAAVDENGDPITYGPFQAHVDCTFLGDPVYATGYDADHPMTVTIADGQTVALRGLPVGAQCTTTEPDKADAASVDITPKTVTIGGPGKDPADVEAVDVTNHYDVGSLRLRKFVPKAAEQYPISQGPFTLHVTCTLTDASHPDGTTVYDGDVVLQGQQPLTAQIDDLATGSVCAVTEPDPGDATAHVVEPKTVTIGADTTVHVVVTNLFGAGRLLISKSRVGPGANRYGAGPFQVSVRCTYTDVNGNEQPLNTPGGDTRQLTADNDYTASYDPLLVGSTCHVTETKTGGATDSTFTDAGGHPVSDVTITSLTQTLQLNLVNTFDIGQIKVHKVVRGDGSGPFTVAVRCTRDLDGTDTVIDIPGGAERTLSDHNDLTAVYADLPTGAACTLKETDDGGADSTTITPNAGDPSVGSVTVGDATTVTLEVLNTFGPPAPGTGNPPSEPGGHHGLLANTGADRWTTYAALGGLVALLLGSALILASRRRRQSQ